MFVNMDRTKCITAASIKVKQCVSQSPESDPDAKRRHAVSLWNPSCTGQTSDSDAWDSLIIKGTAALAVSNHSYFPCDPTQ